ncbi:MAG TPA: ECF-type sigma factor [Candidatus Angelobacter sp.]|nr:ECF-type sigma factor [Candidatus Angelobacter sp.]
MPPCQETACAKPQKRSLDELFPIYYRELRRMALSFMRRERTSHTLQPTALIHEAYMRLATQRHTAIGDQMQFFGMAALMMRRILVNYAEAHNAEKRGADLRVPLEEEASFCSASATNLSIVALNDALSELAAIDSEKARIVELRFFGGLTMPEIAGVLGKSRATVERQWSLARAWLYREMYPAKPSA